MATTDTVGVWIQIVIGDQIRCTFAALRAPPFGAITMSAAIIGGRRATVSTIMDAAPIPIAIAARTVPTSANVQGLERPATCSPLINSLLTISS
ncbi:hypothetical protein BwSF21_62470 [Bradyrhizobium ottawaense]|nr:hypothetical protein BwSF21_62470 [Bradyrhizobium ottawaense]